jgi:hypothetical protein
MSDMNRLLQLLSVWFPDFQWLACVEALPGSSLFRFAILRFQNGKMEVLWDRELNEAGELRELCKRWKSVAFILNLHGDFVLEGPLLPGKSVIQSLLGSPVADPALFHVQEIPDPQLPWCALARKDVLSHWLEVLIPPECLCISLNLCRFPITSFIRALPGFPQGSFWKLSDEYPHLLFGNNGFHILTDKVPEITSSGYWYEAAGIQQKLAGIMAHGGFACQLPAADPEACMKPWLRDLAGRWMTKISRLSVFLMLLFGVIRLIAWGITDRDQPANSAVNASGNGIHPGKKMEILEKEYERLLSDQASVPFYRMLEDLARSRPQGIQWKEIRLSENEPGFGEAEGIRLRGRVEATPKLASWLLELEKIPWVKAVKVSDPQAKREAGSPVFSLEVQTAGQMEPAPGRMKENIP